MMAMKAIRGAAAIERRKRISLMRRRAGRVGRIVFLLMVMLPLCLSIIVMSLIVTNEAPRLSVCYYQGGRRAALSPIKVRSGRTVARWYVLCIQVLASIESSNQCARTWRIRCLIRPLPASPTDVKNEGRGAL